MTRGDLAKATLDDARRIAQLALTQSQSDQAQALSDYRIAIARLERALGRR